MIFFTLCLLAFASLAVSVSVLNPLDNQLPLIARINQPFSWSFSQTTFGTTNNTTLTFTTSTLPGWLSFDPTSRTFSGIPAKTDEGRPQLTVTAHDDTLSTSASSHFYLPVTQSLPPTVSNSIEKQFYAANSAISSVFPLIANSAIATPNPALRVPPSWSFSVGFQWNTFKCQGEVFYEVSRADGSDLPSWMKFNPKTITLNGFSPDQHDTTSPTVVSLLLHGSDEKGYTASTLPFDLVVAEHELSVSASSLPTMNVTAGTSFNFTLTSASDFVGVLVDGKPLQSQQIATLTLDTSGHNSWLSYDSEHMLLSGQPPDKPTTSNPVFPVKLTTRFNQTIETNVSLAIVPSYFSESTLPSIFAADGNVHFNLMEYFSNATTDAQRSSVNLTASYEPREAADYLKFDPQSAQLTGMIYANFSTGSESAISTTFTAYSHITHSTAHTSLSISLPEIQDRGSRSHVGSHARPKIALGLGIAFGAIGGIIVLCLLLGAFRRCLRVEDTAVGGEAAMNAWSEKDKKWYGLDEETGAGDTWPDEKAVLGTNMQNPYVSSAGASRAPPNYGDLGLGNIGPRLERVSARSDSNTSSLKNGSDGGLVVGYGVMRKGEFIHRIRETVRRVSDTISGARPASLKMTRPRIARPTILRPSTPASPIPLSGPSPFARTSVEFGSSILGTDSASNSTGDRSIPRRRSDFAPPRSPALVHFIDTRRSSADSIDSLQGVDEDAVVYTATRATSLRSGKTTSGISYGSIPPSPMPQSSSPRPRLVPFTNVTPVPTPKLSDFSLHQQDNFGKNIPVRVPSQTAKVFKDRTSGVKGDPAEVQNSTSADELTMGIHYVQALGGDATGSRLRTNHSSLTVSTNTRFSSYSLPQSQKDDEDDDDEVLTYMARPGYSVAFRVPISRDLASKKFEVRLVSGQPVPDFLNHNIRRVKEQTTIVFMGTPTADEVGEYDIGVFTLDADCVARAVLKVQHA